MTHSSFDSLFRIITALQRSRISFSLSVTRDDAITVLAAVPGERWEVDVFRDGGIEVEVFQSDGTIAGASELDVMIRKFAD